MANSKVYPKAYRIRFTPIKAQTKQLLLHCSGAFHIQPHSLLISTSLAPMCSSAHHDGFTAEEELYRAWWLVTNDVGYTQKELLNLDPQQSRIVRLAEELRVWRAKLSVSEEAKQFQRELEARIRRRKKLAHKLECVLKAHLLHPACVLDEVQGTVLILKHAADAALGAARRKQLKRFGKLRGTDIHAEREIEHKKWNRAAAAEWRKDPSLRKGTVAGIVKRELKLAESISAIRHVIKKPDLGK